MTWADKSVGHTSREEKSYLKSSLSTQSQKKNMLIKTKLWSQMALGFNQGCVIYYLCNLGQIT